MIKNILKKIKNKRGASMVEFTYAMLLFITLFVAGYEFFTMGYKYLTVSNFANELSSTIARQGGIQTSMPRGYGAGGTTYKSSSVLNGDIDKLRKSIGQDKEDISIKLAYQNNNSDSMNNVITLNSGTNVEIPYLNRFEVSISYKFKFELLDKLVPTLTSYTITKTKGDVSQFEHDYNTYD